MEYRLITSNRNKYEEFCKYGVSNVTIELGKDLREVDSPIPSDVVTYKALEAGAGYIVEDTSLFINGFTGGTKIRYLLDELPKYVGKEARWYCYIAVNTGAHIMLFSGGVSGRIVSSGSDNPDSFGFDNVFQPHASTLPAAYLKALGSYEWTPRYQAIQRLLNESPYEVIRICDIPPWIGDYQS